MKTTVSRYSLIAAGILIVLGLLNWFAIAKQLGYQAAEIVGYLSMILSLSMIYFAIRHFRMKHSNGSITFGKGFQIGILITLITSGIFFVYSTVYFMLWGDDFKAWAYEHLKTMDPNKYQEYLKQVEQMGPLYNSAAFQGLVMFLTVFFIGLIITLISAVVLKKS